MTTGTGKITTLIVDAGALIKGVQLAAIGENFYTTPHVMAEVRDRQVRQHVAALPYQIHERVPTADAMRAVTEFARKTGDIAVLSANDLGILALTWDLEKLSKGSRGMDHLRKEPLQAITQVGRVDRTASTPAGQQQHQKQQQEQQEDQLEEENDEQVVTTEETLLHGAMKELSVHNGDDGDQGDDQDNDDDNQDQNQDPDDDSDGDGGGWITPANVKRVKERQWNARNGGGGQLPTDQGPVDVACITTDFAMQNVLLQMGLILYSVEGMRIRYLKNWVLRCHACYTITKDLDKKFCPKCGNNTLIRTSTSIDPATGKITYYLKKNFQYNVRGTRYTLPAPKGGRASGGQQRFDLILREDQKEYQNQLRRIKKKKNPEDSIFDLDYVPLTGDRKKMPATLPTIGFGRRNPNEARKTRK